jgi:hypothetical protein
VSELSPEDIERLASRLAMLASEDGEADNAGRAVGNLARRLGLSGGDLKAIFMAGARGELKLAQPTDQPQTARELATLRRQVKLLEGAARRAQEERDVLAAENSAMRVAQYRRRTTRRVASFVVAIGVVLVSGVVGMVALYGPDLGPGPYMRTDAARTTVPGAAVNSSGIVRGPRASLYRDPDRNGPLVATLPQGTRVAVRRVLWNMMTQWAEVDASGQLGYISTTEIELY